MATQNGSPKRQDPLGFMTNLSPWVSIYRPPKELKHEESQTIAGKGSEVIPGETTAVESTHISATPDVATTGATGSITDQTGPGESAASKPTDTDHTIPDEAFSHEDNTVEAVAEITTNDDPALIVLFPWFSAGRGTFAKYVNAYRSIYPSAEILLVLTSMKQLLWRPGRETPDVKPAIPIIKAVACNTSEKPDTTTKPRILVHAFSNAGSAMLARVRQAYGEPFPPHVTIFDSGPGLYSFSRCLNGATAGLPRLLWVATWPASALITVSYATMYAGRRDAFRYWYEMHNEVGGEIRRTYIYSGADEMISISHVEKHAHEAGKKGYNVRLEKFDGSAHVSHMRLDEERYWKIIKESWEGLKATPSKL